MSDVRFTYYRTGNPFSSWIVGCDFCKRRLHVDWAGRFHKHNIRKGEQCAGSFNASEEFKERAARVGL